LSFMRLLARLQRGDGAIRGPLQDVSLPAIFMPSRVGSVFNPRARLYFHPAGTSGELRLTQPPSIFQLPPLPEKAVSFCWFVASLLRSSLPINASIFFNVKIKFWQVTREFAADCWREQYSHKYRIHCFIQHFSSAGSCLS